MNFSKYLNFKNNTPEDVLGKISLKREELDIAEVLVSYHKLVEKLKEIESTNQYGTITCEIKMFGEKGNNFLNVDCYSLSMLSKEANDDMLNARLDIYRSCIKNLYITNIDYFGTIAEGKSLKFYLSDINYDLIEESILSSKLISYYKRGILEVELNSSDSELDKIDKKKTKV